MEEEQEQKAMMFKVGQRVHISGDPQRVGTVKYVGSVEGYGGMWVGVDWDAADSGKHDGSINGVRYFNAKSRQSGSFVRPNKLSAGISFLQALYIRYRARSTQEQLDEMYVLSTTNRRVLVELVGEDKIKDKLSRFDELRGASLSYLGVSLASFDDPAEIRATLPNLEELDLTGNLLSEWKDLGKLSENLPSLTALNLSNNLMGANVADVPLLKHLRVLVLNNTGVNWSQVWMLKQSLPSVEELHLMGNNISKIDPIPSLDTKDFDSLRLLNLDDNSISEWNEIIKLSQFRSLEQLYLNKNNLERVFFPDHQTIHEIFNQADVQVESSVRFQNLHCLLLGANGIQDLASIDSLNSFPKLVILHLNNFLSKSKDIRLSDNPITDPGRGGVPRFVLVARLAKVKVLNGSEVSPRERKESEIRYVRLVMSKDIGNPEKLRQLHPRFFELKEVHGIEDERLSTALGAPKKMASGLLTVTLNCVGPSLGEKPPLTKKLPATTTVGKLKLLCESFFKLKGIKPKLFLEEEGSPLPVFLEDEMASLLDLGVGTESVILVDEES